MGDEKCQMRETNCLATMYQNETTLMGSTLDTHSHTQSGCESERTDKMNAIGRRWCEPMCAVLSLCANISNDWLHIQRVQIQSVWLSIRIGELLEANASIEYLQSFHHGWAIHSEIIVSNAIRYSPLHLLHISLSSSLSAFFSVCWFVCFSAFILSIQMQNVWISYDAKSQASHTIPFHCRLHYSNFEYFDAINGTLF